ncbi:O-antigen ligase family protein (plasmid) [Klebsiella aerogenes]
MASSILVAGLAGYYIFLLHAAWMNNGGSGVELPYNLIAWCFMSALSFVFWILQPSVSKSVLTPLYLSLFAGALLMSLPLIWSPSLMAFYNALPRIGGLWAGMIFLLMLRSAAFTERQTKILLHSLVFAGIAEALIILCELYFPGTWLPVIWQKLMLKYGRYGVGVFQQVNVTASFLATSLAICLMLFASGTFTTNNSNAERIRLTLLATAIILLTSVLTFLCSRIGWLSGCSSAGAAWFLLTFTRHKKRSRCHLLLLLLLLTGVVMGCQLMHTSIGQALAEHSGSNHQRILTLYHTVIFSGKHPLLGYGAGTYEGYYQSFMAGLREGNLSRELMSHPHNELLYQYSEGGVIALTGVLLWYGIYLSLWLRAKSVIQVTALLAMLPLILHTQVEYPLYYSVPHWLTLLLLIRLAEGEETSVVTGAHYRASGLIKAAFILLAAYGTVVSLQSIINGNIMNKFENNALASTQPVTRMKVSWIQQFRYEQDINLARMIDFQSTHDMKSLRTFTDMNASIIAVHPDPLLFSNQIAVLNYLHEYQQANEWLLRAHYTLPWETQFSVN